MCRKGDIEAKILCNIRLEDHGHDTLCHVWQGSHSGSGRGGGYPRMSLDGQTVAVHIVAFTNKNGFVPGKKQIDHMCNNRMCVNPDHLQMVTHKKNQKLRVQRSRKATHVISTEYGELPCHDASSDVGGGTEVPEFERILGDEGSGYEESLDGRYLPDHAFWTHSSDVRSSSHDSATQTGERC